MRIELYFLARFSLLFLHRRQTKLTLVCVWWAFFCRFFVGKFRNNLCLLTLEVGERVCSLESGDPYPLMHGNKLFVTSSRAMQTGNCVIYVNAGL